MVLHTAFVLLFALTSCGRQPTLPPQEPAPSASELPRDGSTPRERAPWELWSPRMDLTGAKVLHEKILAGDDQWERGDQSGALRTWLSLPPKQTLPSEKRALAVRIASGYLTLGQPNQALAALSTNFSALGTKVTGVDPVTAIVLGWAYQQSKDPDQALAWFSRAAELSPRANEHGTGAGRGIEYTLASLPPESFEATVSRWRSNELVTSYAARERQRRERPGYQFLPPPSLVPRTQTAEVPAPSAPAALPRVAVLLPLSGPHGTLGSKTKKGVELALAGVQGAFEFEFVDSSGEPVTAAQETHSLISSKSYSAILGPLLSEPAVSVSEMARSYGIPILNLSKRDNFPLGAGVYRLGATTRSLVRTLVSVASERYRLSKIAIVFPDDPSGQQFATEFRSELASRGITPVFESSYPKNSLPSLATLASQLDTALTEVDAIFFPDSLANASRFFSSLSPELRGKVRPLGTSSWDNKLELTNSRAALDGAVYVTPFFSSSSRPIVSSFLEAYRTTYHEPPDFLAAQGFDAASLLVGALNRARAEQMDFESAFVSISHYEGVTGAIRVDQGGELQREYAVVEFSGGNLVEVARPPTLEPQIETVGQPPR